MQEIKVAILGYGGIARAHHSGYRILAAEGYPVRLVALCDIDPEQFRRETSINIATEKSGVDGLHLYTDFEEMLTKEDFDTVDICLPTYLHKEYAVRALAAGKNVQSEKPMALSADDCAEMVAAAKKSGKQFMIGQCLRFSSDYLAAKEVIDSGKYGKVLAAHFERLSALPRWGYEQWFMDTARSGGCMLDMSIHDIDMARFLFGEPASVSAISYDRETRHQWSESRLFYKDGPLVTIIGSWDEAPGTPFTASFRINFEKATLVWKGGEPVRVYTDGREEVLTYEARDYMAEEIRYLAELTATGKKNDRNPAESAMNTVALVETLKASADARGKELPFVPKA